ncbi:MAG TPA: hypothetical protein VGZ91_20705 [Candidatus Sulfotelmatobacter sp.]|nr:hypothetical protein [Candidatus Sulfotelmatobacter sp.]
MFAEKFGAQMSGVRRVPVAFDLSLGFAVFCGFAVFRFFAGGRFVFCFFTGCFLAFCFLAAFFFVAMLLFLSDGLALQSAEAGFGETVQ